MSLEIILAKSMAHEAAVYYLKFCGRRATQKQVDQLLKTVGPAVIRMALERGWKPPSLIAV